MNRPLAFFAAVLMAAPAAAQPAPTPVKPLSLEHRMLLRCSAAFAIVAKRQEAGDPQAKAWPPLAQRGSEFFVRASARVMDEAQLDQAGIAAALTAEARALTQGDELGKIMPGCLATLNASGL